MRTKTPPELKWLLVERATLAGDICLLEKRQMDLAAELVKLRATLQALDTTIPRCAPDVRADAAGAIRRHTREYGGAWAPTRPNTRPGDGVLGALAGVG